MTEGQIINNLYTHYGRRRGGKHAKLMVDRVFVFEQWESDFLVLLKSGLFVEHEIKCTRVDYLNDYKKYNRHKCLSGKIACLRPNKFYFTCPVGLIEPHEIPDYAGLMYYFPGEKNLTEIKPAPFLHKEKMNLFQELATKLMYKYLNLRKQ